MIPSHPFMLIPSGAVPATPGNRWHGKDRDDLGLKSMNTDTIDQNARPETSCEFPEEIGGELGDPDDMHTKEGSV